jgi:hypothetical protein
MPRRHWTADPSFFELASLATHVPWAHPASTLIAHASGKALHLFPSSLPQWLAARPAFEPPNLKDTSHHDPSFTRDSFLQILHARAPLLWYSLQDLFRSAKHKTLRAPASPRIHVDPLHRLGRHGLGPCLIGTAWVASSGVLRTSWEWDATQASRTVRCVCAQ